MAIAWGGASVGSTPSHPPQNTPAPPAGEPNCYSRVLRCEAGESHIVICALRDLRRGEELTYNYKVRGARREAAALW